MYLILAIFIIVIFVWYLYFFPSWTYTAIIIEPRKHPALELVLTNFTKNLDARWNFIIFHGNQNGDFVKNVVNSAIPHEKHRIHYKNLDVDNLNIHSYSGLFYDPAFYDKIPTEMFLVFQTDTLISHQYKNVVYDFMKYDYVGAPWRSSFYRGYVGNGGLSLRRKSKMLEILGAHDFSDFLDDQGNFIEEDLFFCFFNRRVPMSRPSFEEAKRFSMEEVFHNGGSFGIHKPWLYLTGEELNHIEEYIPELKMLFDLWMREQSRVSSGVSSDGTA